MLAIEDLQLIGEEVAIRWSNGAESYYPMERLRAYSPSAENTGEQDLLGRVYGGTDQTEFPGVTITGWQGIGGYAVQFHFSDGHRTGIFSYGYLWAIWEALNSPDSLDG